MKAYMWGSIAAVIIIIVAVWGYSGQDYTQPTAATPDNLTSSITPHPEQTTPLSANNTPQTAAPTRAAEPSASTGVDLPKSPAK